MYKVMIVDDEMLVRIGVKSLINWKELGYEIIAEAANGQMAYEKYLALKPDVVITDIKMPKKDGLWLTQKIREEDSSTGIILLTCYDDFGYAQKAISLQIFSYILKAEMQEDELCKTMMALKKKFDEEGKNGEELNNLESNNQEDYFLGLLLSETRTNEFVVKEFQKGQMNWKARCYCFVQFDFTISIRENAYTKEQIPTILGTCLEVIRNRFEEGETTCMAKQFGQSLTFFLMGDNLNEIKVQRIIEQLRDSIKQYFNIKFKSANTKIEHSIEESRSHLEYLFKVPENMFYLENDRHLEYINSDKKRKQSFVYGEEYVKELSEYMEHFDEDSIHKILTSLEEKARKHRRESIETKLGIIHLLNDMLKRLDMYLSEGSELFDFQKKIMDARDLQEIISVLHDFFVELGSEIVEGKVDNSEVLVKKSIQYVQDRLSEKISLEEIARHVGLSKYYFSVLFKKEQGINFSSYLNKTRIERAQELLKIPLSRVNDVYMEVGFNDPQYFGKIFKKYTGITVSQYKNKQNSKEKS